MGESEMKIKIAILAVTVLMASGAGAAHKHAIKTKRAGGVDRVAQPAAHQQVPNLGCRKAHSPVAASMSPSAKIAPSGMHAIDPNPNQSPC